MDDMLAQDIDRLRRVPGIQKDRARLDAIGIIQSVVWNSS